MNVKVIKKYSKKIIIYILTFILGFVGSEFTYLLREDLRNGNVIFEYDGDIEQDISLKIESETGLIITLYNIQQSKKLKPGQYSFKIFIGPLLIEEGYFEVLKNKTTKVDLSEINTNFFIFNIEIDKNIYGKGETILTSIYSNLNSFVYFFHRKNGKLIELNPSPILLKANKTKMIENISAKNETGEDNIIAIALKLDDIDLLQEAKSELTFTTKSNMNNKDRLWRSDIVSFVVE